MLSESPFTFPVQSVVDTSDGCGAKFEVEIISSAFEGQKPLARHRLVSSGGKSNDADTNTRSRYSPPARASQLRVPSCVAEQVQSQQVNAALKDEMPKLHALSIKKAATPAEAGK